jgi:4-hydroxy 2-oxovalerate aldolase
MKINLLDSSLRDGGYVNNWNFGEDNIYNIVNALVESNTEFIECGFLGKNDNKDRSIFNNLLELNLAMPHLYKTTPLPAYTVMLNFADKDLFDAEDINNINEQSVYIRLAFFKEDRLEALMYAKYLMNLGYRIIMQMMATHMYSDIELKKFISEVNQTELVALSIVDSFGMFTDFELGQYFGILNSSLNTDIWIGFHGHNNLNMAVSNCFRFIAMAEVHNRDILIDGSVCGMGRGAGNCPIEILMPFLNTNYNKEYKLSSIALIYDKCLADIKSKTPWGYSMHYMASAILGINPSYVWYLETKGIVDLDKLMIVLKLIPDENKHTLNKKVLHDILKNEVLKGNLHD